MKFTKEQIELLKEQIDPKDVSEREGGFGKPVSYVEGWHVIDEANRIFGFDGWSCETLETVCVCAEPRAVTYTARVRVKIGDIVREGTGAGHGNQQNFGNNHEAAIKEAETDARKRALMTFGNQFGLSLYDKKQTWKKQKSQKQTQSEPSVTEMALKWIQKAPSQKHLDEIKKRLDAQMKEGNLSDSERHKLTNAIVQKEASLL